MKPNIKAFTLVELLVVIAILGIIAAIVCGGLGACNRQKPDSPSFVGTVIRKYEVQEYRHTTLRVDVQREGSSFIETFENRDDLISGKYNSVTVYANLIEGHKYVFQVLGQRSEAWSMFPNIISASPVPTAEKKP